MSRIREPRTRAGRAALWAALLLLATLPLAARRPFVAWTYDLGLEDAGRRELALHALRRADDAHLGAALGGLARALPDRDARVRVTASETLSVLGPRVVEEVLRADVPAGHPWAEVLAGLLEAMGEDAAMLLSGELLEGEDAGARRRAAEALRRSGPLGESAAARLEALARDGDPRRRSAALRALAQLDVQGAAAFRAAQLATRDEDPDVRLVAFRLLSRTERMLERARDPALAPEIEELFLRELGWLPGPLRAALDQGLSGAR